MINFFRRIRYKLMETGKTGKYLKYAIGEIVLVVIGILIALQVNNWNELRKTHFAEQLLLNNLREEMINNRESLKESMLYHDKSRNSAKIILEIFNDQYQYKNTQEVDSLLGLIQWAWTYDPAMGVLEAIKNSGHLNSIKNAKLRALIAAYEDQSLDAREENKIIQNIIINDYVPMVNKYVSIVQRLKYLGDNYITVKSSKFSSDYDELFNDRALESLIAYIHTWRIDELSEEANLLNMIDSFIDILDAEINND